MLRHAWLLCFCILASPSAAQTPLVLTTMGIGPRAAEGLRRDLERRIGQEVVHGEAPEGGAPSLVVRVRNGRIRTEFRRGDEVHRGRGRAGGRRSLLVAAAMDALEHVEWSQGQPGSSIVPSSNVPSSSVPSSSVASNHVNIGGTLLFTDVGEQAEPRRPASNSVATERIDGALLALGGGERYQVRSPARTGRMILLATNEDDGEVRRSTALTVAGSSGANVLLSLD